MAAVKLTEDTIPTDILSEQAHNLEQYVQKLRNELPNLDSFSWRYKVFISP
jgi:elongator complex protein 1